MTKITKRLPPLNWLRAFDVSAKYLNFTQAANELNLTQSAVSQQVKGLEAQLGVLLFKRLPRGLELTDAGKSYTPVVHEAIERLIVATDELFAKNNQSTITIRASLVYLTHWLAPRIADFYQQHPNIKLKFSSYIWNEAHTQHTDLEIRHGSGKWPGFFADRLSWDSLTPVCSPEYFAIFSNSSNPFTLDTLLQCQLINVIGYNEGWGNWFNKLDLKSVNLDRCIQLDSLIPALELAAQGQGVALGRTCLIEQLIKSKRLMVPLVEKVTTDEAFYLIVPENKYTQTNATIFRTWLLDQVTRRP
jgi:LysR family glycine cleavage system transcriptional activator